MLQFIPIQKISPPTCALAICPKNYPTPEGGMVGFYHLQGFFPKGTVYFHHLFSSRNGFGPTFLFFGRHEPKRKSLSRPRPPSKKRKKESISAGIGPFSPSIDFLGFKIRQKNHQKVKISKYRNNPTVL